MSGLEAKSFGEWLGAIALLAVVLFLLNLLVIGGYMCWQWALNR